jgi:hypothetical protein
MSSPSLSYMCCAYNNVNGRDRKRNERGWDMPRLPKAPAII